MDGVIIDSNPLHRLAWEEYNRRHGVETTEAMHDHMYGKRNDAIIRDFLGHHLTDEDVHRHSDEKERLYREMMLPRVPESLVPGIREFLELHAGHPMAVASNANAVNVRFVLDEAGLASFFRVSVHGGQVKRGKPHPDIYLKAAELLGVPAEACVVFEDSVTGVAAGLAAGMPVVGLATTHDELPGVSLLVRDFRDPALSLWLRRRSGDQMSQVTQLPRS
jgi:beta-phosphoglucomutase family hydrolase